MRICAWSGPRNISTALMRSFEARGDCEVVDEPLYAAYLAATGKDHPGREQILASQPTDARRSWATLQHPPIAHRYEKHMAHHWLPSHHPSWIGAARHVLLIRDPARVVASYARVREAPEPADLGLLQQAALRAHLPGAVVIDGDDVLADPEPALRALCAALDLPWTDRMLSWPAGRRATDGVWAPFWYAAVEASTGFTRPSPPGSVPDGLQPIVDAIRPVYDALRCDAITGRR